MKANRVKFTILSVAAAFMVGCGGGGDNNNNDDDKTLPAVTYSYYSIKVVDDAVLNAKISAIGCEEYSEKGGGEYELKCTQKPTVIVASGGTIDMNGNGQVDSNDVPMALPFTLDVTQSGAEKSFVVSPLTTLAAEAKESELEALAEKLGISKDELFEDLSRDGNKKEILQLINAQFIAASENGVIDMPAFLGKFKEYLLSSGSTDAKESIANAVAALKNDTDAPKIFGGIGFNGFISEAERLNVVDLATYYDSKKSDPNKTVFIGYVYDEALANANVSIYIDGTLIASSTSDSSGKFDLEVDTDKIGNDKIIKIEAVLNGYKGDNVKLITFLTSTQIKELAKNLVSVSDLIDIVVSNVTTAEYVVAKKLNGGNDFTDADTLKEKLLQAQIEESEKVKETAALIKYIVDTNASQSSSSDTLAYVESKLDTNLTLYLNATEQENIEIFKTEIESDPILSKQLEPSNDTVATNTTLKTLFDNGIKEFYFIWADSEYDQNGSFYYQKGYTKMSLGTGSVKFEDYRLDAGSWKKSDEGTISASFDGDGVYYFTDPTKNLEKVWLLSSSSVYNSSLNRSFNVYMIAHTLYAKHSDEFYLSTFNVEYDGVADLDQNIVDWDGFKATYTTTQFHDIGVLNSDGSIDSTYWSRWEHFTIDGKDFLRVYSDYDRDARIYALDFVNKKAYKRYELLEEYLGKPLYEICSNNYELVEAFRYVPDSELNIFDNYSQNDLAKVSDMQNFLETLLESGVPSSTSTTTGSPTFTLDDTILSHMWKPNALISPNGGETWNNGENREIEWSTSEIVGDTVNCYVLHDDPSNILNAMSNNDANSLANAITSANWHKFTNDAINSGNIGLDPSVLAGTGNAYLVLIVSDNGFWDISDGMFSLNTSTLNYSDLIVGKTYYIAVTDVPNKHVETIYFMADNTLRVTWEENGQNMEKLFDYSLDGNILHLTNQADPNDTHTVELLIINGELLLYKTYAEAQAAL